LVSYIIAASIVSTTCPDLLTAPPRPLSLTLLSNQQLHAMQPRRVRLPVVDQMLFNACTAPHDAAACTSFSMHGDLGYIGPPRYALWTRHVSSSESVVFFYQWGINKAELYPSSVLKVPPAHNQTAAITAKL
jgi:hypothetical protein